MKENGFTLIELLAVIVILAIIALIATPIVLNIIEDSKKSAFVQTGNGIVDAAEYYYMKEMSDGAKPTENKVFTFDEPERDIEGLEFDGEIPQVGTLTVDVNGNVELVAHNNQYCITKGYGDNEVSIKDYDDNCEITYTNGIMSSKNGCIQTGNCDKGTSVSVKVNDTQTYNFYVLSENADGTTNLIMDRNIYYYSATDTSSETTSTNTGLLAWEDGGSNVYGPRTAMDYLHKATKNWTNIPDMIINYNDEGGMYGAIQTENGTPKITKITKKDGTQIKSYENLKARMPYKSEVSDYDSIKKTNAYLYNNLDSAGGIIYSGNIAGIYGYWISSSSSSPTFAMCVSYEGKVVEHCVNCINVVDSKYQNGVRPVINLKI